MGGRFAGLVVAVVAAGAFNLVFLEPYGTFKIASVDELVAFVVLAVVVFTVATLVAPRASAGVRRAADSGVELWRRTRRCRPSRRLAAEMQTLGRRRAARCGSVSHDLRTPLAAIGGRVGSPRRRRLRRCARDDLLELVADEAERLDRLVQEPPLDEPHRGGPAAAGARQAVPIDELLDDRVRRLAQLLRDTTVIVDAPPDLPLVSADYDGRTGVTNLLENASRHSPLHAGDRRERQARDDFVAVSVTDQGPGLDPMDVERLFQPFERVPSRSVGLSLAICRAIVEAHGGAIAVESANGDGSPNGARFTFTLPAHRG